MFLSTVRRRSAQLTAALAVLAMSGLAWLRAEHVADDRGSDSSEKALMVILAITIGGVVTAAAVLFVNGKTALFK